MRALFVLAIAIASACLREQRVEHFADHALASARKLADAFELLNLRTWPALDLTTRRPAVDLFEDRHDPGFGKPRFLRGTSWLQRCEKAPLPGCLRVR